MDIGIVVLLSMLLLAGGFKQLSKHLQKGNRRLQDELKSEGDKARENVLRSAYRENSPPETSQRPSVFTDEEFVLEAKNTKEVNYNCGHKGPYKFTLMILGEDCTPKKKYFKDRPFCPDCIRSVIIRCALCGNPIFPGSPVARYGDMKDFKGEWKTYADEEETVVIGCMGWDCCPSGGFFSGHWTGEYIDSPFEYGSVAAEAFATGKVVSGTIGNSHDSEK